MKPFLSKFFSDVKEWFADAADHIKLAVLDSKITGLKEELDWEIYCSDRHEIEISLDIYCEAYNRTLYRVRARDDRHRLQHWRAVTR